MSPASLLIWCVNSAAANGPELEEWLVGAAARFGSEGMGLYRAPEEGPSERDVDQPRQGLGRADGIWLLAVYDKSALDSSRLAELLAEMRLLGLSPVVFRPGPLPMAHQGIANVF
jgi:hypothetical protein